MDDIKYLESKVFKLNVGNVIHKVEFKLTELQYGMKFVAISREELINSARFFSTFGDVNQNNWNMCYIHGDGPVNKWKPWKYEDRLTVAKLVQEKKKELEKENINKDTILTKLTNFVGQKQKCRQGVNP